MVLTCKCKNAYMDKKYGKNRRVFNSMAKTKDSYRCTVCLAEKVKR